MPDSSRDTDDTIGQYCASVIKNVPPTAPTFMMARCCIELPTPLMSKTLQNAFAISCGAVAPESSVLDTHLLQSTSSAYTHVC